MLETEVQTQMDQGCMGQNINNIYYTGDNYAKLKIRKHGDKYKLYYLTKYDSFVHSFNKY